MARLFEIACGVSGCSKPPTHRIEKRKLLHPADREPTDLAYCDDHAEDVLAIARARRARWLAGGWDTFGIAQIT